MTVLLRAVPPRPKLCRPRDAARSDSRTMLRASTASSAGGPRRRGVGSAEEPWAGARISHLTQAQEVAAGHRTLLPHHRAVAGYKNGRWLLVLDNADDAAVLSPTNDDSKLSGSGSSALQQHLSTYLPSTRHGSVLVTSRTKRVAMQVVEDSDIIPIKPMDDAAAHALLCEKLGDIQEEDDSIAKLATTLDHMPLALVQVAAYIRERTPRCSVRQYL
ncbi:hypothetical protein GQ44DRAFT_830396 [Phaeosphaeriaceae sp. PMI808]|nr:hypothetical protein GQ44DRAFT_830396 [Phaeosphaeriaceae sp. PMI808]